MADNQTIPLKGMRGMIAERMAASVSGTARATLFSEADATSLMAERQAIKANGGEATVEDLLLSAIAHTLVRHPDLNGTLEDGEIRLRGSIDLGVAVALPQGLVAPAIKGCEDLSPAEISQTRRDLVDRARSNKLSVAEMTGASFTVSNLGHYRIDHFTPLINIPQIAILGLGRIVRRAAVSDNGTVEARATISLSLSIDHRAIDGAPAAAFLSGLADAIEAF